MNIINDLYNYILTLTNYTTPYIDVLQDDSDSIAIRVEPGSSNEMRDLTGARYGDFQFAIYCKSQDIGKIVDQLNYYISSLDLVNFDLTSRTRIKCEPLTQAHYVSKAENGDGIYTASFHIEYFEGV